MCHFCPVLTGSSGLKKYNTIPSVKLSFSSSSSSDIWKHSVLDGADSGSTTENKLALKSSSILWTTPIFQQSNRLPKKKSCTGLRFLFFFSSHFRNYFNWMCITIGEKQHSYSIRSMPTYSKSKFGIVLNTVGFRLLTYIIKKEPQVLMSVPHLLNSRCKQGIHWFQ